MDSMHHPIWVQTQEDLKQSMNKEIDLMREILFNMYQEEILLLQQDKESWKKLMQSRFYLIESIKVFRDDRTQIAQKLVKLSDEEFISCEIALLLDQLMALSQKINSQNVRNQMLLENPEQCIAPSHLQLLPKTTSKKKFLMTLP